MVDKGRDNQISPLATGNKFSQPCFCEDKRKREQYDVINQFAPHCQYKRKTSTKSLRTAYRTFCHKLSKGKASFYDVNYIFCLFVSLAIVIFILPRLQKEIGGVVNLLGFVNLYLISVIRDIVIVAFYNILILDGLVASVW